MTRRPPRRNRGLSPAEVRPLSKAQRRLHECAIALFAERGVREVTAKDLAEVAGVSRATVQRHCPDLPRLFEEVATRLALDLTARVEGAIGGTRDPVERLSVGIRLFVREAHLDPQRGRFVAQFGVTTPTLRALLAAAPAQDLADGVRKGRLSLRQEQVTVALAMLSASVIGLLILVLEGHLTWREAGSAAAELTLRSFGVSAEEARALASSELPTDGERGPGMVSRGRSRGR